MIINSIAYVLGKVKERFRFAAGDDRGIGVVEVILILVVLIGLVVIFKEQLTGIVESVFGRIADDAKSL